MNESQTKPTSRRLVIIGSLVAVGVIGFFVLLPCATRELNSRALLSRDIGRSRRIDAAVRVYHMDRGFYPASLDVPDFQPYIDADIAAFIREGRVSYHPPAADSPPTFVIIHMTTPYGEYSFQLDGTPLYPNSK